MTVSYYILVDPDKPNNSKVGITKNPQQRLRAYRTAAPSCYFLKIYNNVERFHEKRILSLLKDTFTVKSEYVYCQPGIVKNIVEGYFEDNGIEYS